MLQCHSHGDQLHAFPQRRKYIMKVKRKIWKDSLIKWVRSEFIGGHCTQATKEHRRRSIHPDFETHGQSSLKSENIGPWDLC